MTTRYDSSYPMFVKTDDDRLRWKASLDICKVIYGLEYPRDVDLLQFVARSVSTRAFRPRGCLARSPKIGSNRDQAIATYRGARSVRGELILALLGGHPRDASGWREDAGVSVLPAHAHARRIFAEHFFDHAFSAPFRCSFGLDDDPVSNVNAHAFLPLSGFGRAVLVTARRRHWPLVALAGAELRDALVRFLASSSDDARPSSRRVRRHDLGAPRHATHTSNECRRPQVRRIAGADRGL